MPAQEAAAERPRGTLQRINIAIGNFFFRYRNALFPVVIVVTLLMRPRVLFDRLDVDRGLMIAGAIVAVAGQLLRLLTIGFDYIERGGKGGKVFASRLVQGGVYGITRNPMYTGNALIVIGLGMLAGSPGNYLLIIPFFLFVYQAIIAAEEAYLSQRFGRDYQAYCERVPRILPSWRSIGPAFAGLTYDWRRAIRKDLSTMAGLFEGLTLLPLWRTLFLEGWESTQPKILPVAACAIAIGAVYALLSYAKRRKWWFYSAHEPAMGR